MKHSALTVRAVWFAIVLVLGALLAAALPALYITKLSPSPEVEAGIEQMGLSTTGAYWTVAMAAFAALCLSVGLSIVARKPAEPIAWFVSLFLVALGPANALSAERGAEGGDPEGDRGRLQRRSYFRTRHSAPDDAVLLGAPAVPKP